VKAAAHCNTLQHTATHCDTLQHTATHCNMLQHSATICNTLQHTVTHCNTLQRTVTYCSTLSAAQARGEMQHTAVHCNTLQCTATNCTIQQDTARSAIGVSLVHKETKFVIFEFHPQSTFQGEVESTFFGTRKACLTNRMKLVFLIFKQNCNFCTKPCVESKHYQNYLT